MIKTSGIFIDEGRGVAQAAAVYQQRRERLAKQLNIPFFLPGVSHVPGHPHRRWWSTAASIIQDPEFLYLTGINQPGVALLVMPNGKSTIFVPPKDPQKEFWDGVQFGISDDGETGDIEAVLGDVTIKSISNVAEELQCVASDKLAICWFLAADQSPFVDHYWQHKAQLEATLPGCELINVASDMMALRLVLDEQEQQLMRQAVNDTGAVFESLVKSLPDCTTETEVYAQLIAEISQRSRDGQSFPAIVAGGENATVLHYNKNDELLPENGLLLLDFGGKKQSMHADMTRVVPVNGRFNPLQATLYQIVLDTQLTVEKATRPGVTIAELNELAWETMNALVEQRFLSQGGTMKRAYDKAPHNIGHLLGHLVHDGDPERVYRTTPLIAGQVITNEPGLYGYFTWEIDGQSYAEHIGIRIEDDLLLTKEGCENLSKNCPKTIAEIEALRSNC